MSRLLKFMFGNSLQRKVSKISFLLTRFLESELNYTSAVAFATTQYFAKIAVCTILLSAFFMVFLLCGIASAIVVIPTLFPQITFQIILLTSFATLGVLVVVCAAAILMYVDKTKKILTEYNSHWRSNNATGKVKSFTKTSDKSAQIIDDVDSNKAKSKTDFGSTSTSGSGITWQ